MPERCCDFKNHQPRTILLFLIHWKGKALLHAILKTQPHKRENGENVFVFQKWSTTTYLQEATTLRSAKKAVPNNLLLVLCCSPVRLQDSISVDLFLNISAIYFHLKQ